METFKFHNDSPILKYCHKSLNSCCFSSLALYFLSIKQIKASKSVSFCIEESLKSKVGNRIDFENAILINENKIKDEAKVNYSLRKYKEEGSYDILTDVSDIFTLVQLMDSLGNLNNDFRVFG